jgi:hypothetical protein
MDGKENYMFKRVICILILLAFLNLLYGCTRIVQVDKDKLDGYAPTERIFEVVYPDGRTVSFDRDDGGRYVSETKLIVGFDRLGNFIKIPIDDILYVKVKRTDVVATTVAVIGVTALAAVALLAIIAATKESCPFVYSFDGSQYVFDAEPLGGAVSKGLEKTDYSRLDYLKPVDGRYRLLLQNEVEEIQYLDEFKLAIVDHDRNIEVIPDLDGRFHCISEASIPVTAVDENGKDISGFVESSDGLRWQTMMPRDQSFHDHDTRHHLTFEFPKPEGAVSAKLLINAGTALWGSNMIREMLQLRGDGVADWYDDIDRFGPKMRELFHFNMREELYLMHLYVKKDGDWVKRGLIPGGGPLITEDRVIEFDVSDIDEDVLTLQLNPPFGFWTIDYVGIEYDSYLTAKPMEISVSTATNRVGEEVGDLLRERDGRYFVMPELNDRAKVDFVAPALEDDLERSVFLKSTGYYKIKLDEKKPEEKELIATMLSTPGAIAEYSLDKYVKWRHEKLGEE